jgi:signal transduction histidine kinase
LDFYKKDYPTLLQVKPETPIKILYIDDDPINRLLVNRLLTSYDFEVLEATSGLEGMALARKETPHLILMDINMPGLDGHETTTRMRSISTLENVPIVAVTARTAKGERELALAAGCDGYIVKPIDVDLFPHQIISYLEGYKETITQDERQRYLGQYSQKLVERLERKIIELEDANVRLQRVDKVKSDFITLAAHELRTPITLVYGYARLMQSTVQGSARPDLIEGSIGDLATRIYHSVHRLSEVVNDVLNIALIESDEMYLDYEPLELLKVINDALSELNPTKHQRMLNISLEALDTLPVIMGDRERLQQVFWNLLSNAIKFTPDDGSISIKGWSSETLAQQKDIDFISDAGVLISVKDSGVGIAANELKEIFEQFYIVGNTNYHSSSKTAFGGGGMGLGLPIARGIVEAHGGQIWVESQGRNQETCPGSTFYVFLPLHPAKNKR